MNNEPYSYINSGFDKFFRRNRNVSIEQTEDEASFNIKQISGSVISSGISTSNDGKLKIDWDKKQVYVSDGARNRVVLGNIEEGGEFVYGIKIYNDQGDLVFDVTSGDANIANSITIGDSNIVLDGDNRRIIVNDGTHDRVLIGFQENGF